MAKTIIFGATIMMFATIILAATPAPSPRTNVVHSPIAAPAPAPGVDCFTYLLNLTDCFTYVEAGSNLTKPDKGCCPELANLVDVQPICLCELIANPDQSPFPIDLKRAIGLPSVCKVQTPPLSACSAAGVPISSPTAAPARSPSGLSTGILSPEGSASSPASLHNGNDGQRTIASKKHFLVGLAIVLFISVF
ncbi:hypothetical protein ACH5RR_009484 [Cinchona calisaya]|uniref:Bifunctional inhibitor/plant lipid transfer protein/seed storage helical domain-containing protein n=1 Tax=Cinchona calisaya TaxID=153742 RepID=A0ABD3AHL9_9GENT